MWCGVGDGGWGKLIVEAAAMGDAQVDFSSEVVLESVSCWLKEVA